MSTDPTPAEGVPAAGGARPRDKAAPVPELNPEGESLAVPDDYFGNPSPAETELDDTEIDVPAVKADFDVDEPAAETTDDTDRHDSDRLDETSAPTRRNVKSDATVLEPEDIEDLTNVESPTESSTGGSLYPGKLPAVRAPGWDQSGAINVEELDERRATPRPHRPESAPELEPASAPSLAAFHEPPQVDDDDVPAMTPVDETQPGTKIRRQLTAVDQAAKELARAALQAEIEKEEKRALQHYEPEEGEIPPSPEVAKRFDVILQLGKGGMAVVYLCRDPRRGGKVLAVKDIRAEMKPGMKVEQRVEHEAMLLKELDHPGIVKVYDFLKFPRGSAIVMEFIDGLPLDHEIGAGRRITWDFGVRILREIGAALGYAHQHGVIHRDIKPDNILYSERHSIMKLVDFGLARIFGDQTEVHMTRTGMVVGTPHYMSPEQVSGKNLDQRSDVYSFGATLYYLLTGQRHVEGSNVMDILEQQRSKDILPPSHLRRDIPGWLSYIVGKMMEIKPDDRYQSMAEVLQDLDRAEQDPENFVRENPRGPVKRYAGVELAPFPPETDNYTGGPPSSHEVPERWPSSQAPEAAERTTRMSAGRHTARTHESSQQAELRQELPSLDEEASPAQISAMLREISGRLEKAEKRQVGPGLLVLIVLLSVLIVMLLIAGGLLLAQREGYLQQFLGW
ncbi:MAG: protein kinase [Planctomycetes bacterium]|nr:protein kinase [Planctomycetota bacterium]MCB9934482.1 protein kinase [Planctomycetota bacterium]